MEKRGERKEGVPVLALAKCLLASYVLTLLLLCLLALLLYKLHLTEGMVTIAISAIYVVTTFTAGFLAGKKMETQKFLWGALLGAAYFVILAVVSVLIKTPETALGNSFWTTMVLCVAGGTLGGMLGQNTEMDRNLTVFEKKSFYKCQIHDIMSKNELRVCMFIYTLASIGALKS